MPTIKVMPKDFYCEEVLSGKIRVEKVKETLNVLAFYHTRPYWETHIVVIPKRHLESLLTVDVEDHDLILELLSVIKEVAAEVLKIKGGARVLTNIGKYQETKHLHFHINSGQQIRPDKKV